jgi:4-aminobutyrate aminotransferase/(S)-3-amino-2-methylpropionate transaminase
VQAIELVQAQESKTPATDETKQITQFCFEHGLITITAGTYSNVIRILVPLVATDAQIDEGLDVLESALAAVCGKKDAIEQLV